MKARIAIGAYASVCLFLMACKAVGTLDWPWTAVLAPIWVPALAVLALVFVLLVLASAFSLLGD
jgi:hypothetical protein